MIITPPNLRPVLYLSGDAFTQKRALALIDLAPEHSGTRFSCARKNCLLISYQNTSCSGTEYLICEHRKGAAQIFLAEDVCDRLVNLTVGSVISIGVIFSIEDKAAWVDT